MVRLIDREPCVSPPDDQEIAEALALQMILELGAKQVESGQVLPVRAAFARIRRRMPRDTRVCTSRR
jgi:hypothetical protein